MGDVSVSWDPDQKALDDRWVDKSLPAKADERLKRRWLSQRSPARSGATAGGVRATERVTAHWVDVGDVADVAKRKKFVVERRRRRRSSCIAHDGAFYALDNVCIHKQRELVKGVILGDRIVCPGHQWAFQLATGWEAKMERCQPTYRCASRRRPVEVDVASPQFAPSTLV